MSRPTEALRLSVVPEPPRIPTLDRTVGGKGSEGGVGKSTGRGAQPARLKLANGRNDHTDSGGREINLGPFEKRAAPECPAGLPKEAREEWERVAPALSGYGVLKPEDRAGLTAYCLCWYRLITAPTQAEFINASRELRAWSVQFGLTPSSEQKLPSPNEESDPFDGS